MSTPQFIDISSFQGQIDFAAYRAWAASVDGIARIAMKSSEGTGFVDPSFKANRAAALAAGIDEIYYYHFSRPDLGNSPVAEANFMQSVVGAIRNSDMIILDYEVQSPLATAQWALAWLVEFGPKYGKLPGIYASSAYIETRLQWPGLNAFPLWLANWMYSPNERPSVPAPWTSYEFVQYSDKATIPGVPGTVDADIFLGGNSLMSNTPTAPQGWTDDGHTLTAPNGVPVVGGFRTHVLTSNWDKDNFPLKPEYQANPVEQSNPKLGAGAAQEFRWKRLAWCQQLGIYEGWLGQELVWYQEQYATLQSQITALKTLPGVGNLATINSLAAQVSTAIAQAGITCAKIGPLSQVQ